MEDAVRLKIMRQFICLSINCNWRLIVDVHEPVVSAAEERAAKDIAICLVSDAGALRKESLTLARRG